MKSTISYSHSLQICCICKVLQTPQEFTDRYVNIGDIISPLASSQYKLNSAHQLFAFQSFTKFPMKPRSLHFQYDFTIKIIYSNIKSYIEREEKADCLCTLFDSKIILQAVLTVLSLQMIF